jgi:hypothetical protein
MESKREQVRLIAGSIVRSLKEALQWADDNERRMDAQPGMRTVARVEELNRAFLIRVSEALERMQRQHGEVPFLQNLIAVIAAYARDTTKIGGERGPYQPANIARLKGTLADRVAQVEQVINQSSSAQPAGGATSAPRPAAAAGATTGHQQPPPLAAASALARPPGPATGAMGEGPPREVQRAPAHAPAPAPAELPPGWVDPDLHQLTAGQPLDRVSLASLRVPSRLHADPRRACRVVSCGAAAPPMGGGAGRQSCRSRSPREGGGLLRQGLRGARSLGTRTRRSFPFRVLLKVSLTSRAAIPLLFLVACAAHTPDGGTGDQHRPSDHRPDRGRPGT